MSVNEQDCYYRAELQQCGVCCAGQGPRGVRDRVRADGVVVERGARALRAGPARALYVRLLASFRCDKHFSLCLESS